jgi:Protein of unknown function (DUF2637)
MSGFLAWLLARRPRPRPAGRPVRFFRHLYPSERAVLCVVLPLVVCTNVVTLILSYNAALRYVESLHMFDPKLAPLFPIVGDAILLICEGAVIYGWMIRHRVDDPTKINRGTAWLGMGFAATATLAANELHAGHSWSHRMMAAFAPVGAFILFNVALSISKWTLMALGRYGNETTVTVGEPELDAHPSPTEARRLSSSSAKRLDAGAGNRSRRGKRKGARGAARGAIEAHLASLTLEQLHHGTSEGEVWAILRAGGVQVSKPYVGRVLGEYRTSHPDTTII